MDDKKGESRPAGEEDWRLLRGQEDYLQDATLYWKKWTQTRANWDHDHCDFCWEAFSYSEADSHEGYTDEDEYTWICKKCFDDFQVLFNWKVEVFNRVYRIEQILSVLLNDCPSVEKAWKKHIESRREKNPGIYTDMGDMAGVVVDLCKANDTEDFNHFFYHVEMLGSSPDRVQGSMDGRGLKVKQGKADNA